MHDIKSFVFPFALGSAGEQSSGISRELADQWIETLNSGQPLPIMHLTQESFAAIQQAEDEGTQVPEYIIGAVTDISYGTDQGDGSEVVECGVCIWTTDPSVIIVDGVGLRPLSLVGDYAVEEGVVYPGDTNTIGFIWTPAP